MAQITLRPIPRDEEPATHTPTDPPSPTSYIFPLLAVITVCAVYVYWRRRQRMTPGPFGLQSFTRGSDAVRLSTDDDGPATHSFIANNASTDSLPTHALADLPVLPSQGASAQPSSLVHPAYQVQLERDSPSPSPRHSAGMEQTGNGFGKIGRRSDRIRSPIEGKDDEDSDDDDSIDDPLQADGKAGAMFGIGVDEDDEERPRNSTVRT